MGWKGRKETVGEAVAKGANGLNVEEAAIVEPNDHKRDALKKMKGKAAVVRKKEELVGIVTPFDLL